MKAKLLAVAKSRMAAECAQKHCYCLKCQEIFTGTHIEHPEKSIPLGQYKNRCVAWVTGEEDWKAIFGAIESEDRAVKRYLLYTSERSPMHRVPRRYLSRASLWIIIVLLQPQVLCMFVLSLL